MSSWHLKTNLKTTAILVWLIFMGGCDLSEPEAELVFLDYLITSDPNDDKIISAGEDIGFSISFKNTGDTTAHSIVVDASCNSKFVEIRDPSESYYSLLPDDTQEAGDNSEFRFLISETAPVGTRFTISLLATTTTGKGFDEPIEFEIEKPDADLDLDHYMIDGDDGALSPGESAKVVYLLRNRGATRASGVYCTVTTTNPDVEEISGNIEDYLGTIDGMSLANKSGQFYVRIQTSAAVDATIPFLLTIRDDYKYTWIVNLAIHLNQGSLLQFVSYQIDDATGNNDGILNPGENVLLKIDIENVGILRALSVVGNLNSDDTNITILDGHSDEYGDLLPESNATSGFNYEILVFATHDSTPIDFSIKLMDDLGNSWENYFAIPVN